LGLDAPLAAQRRVGGGELIFHVHLAIRFASYIL
jgi:hypothetical protein